MKKKNSQEKPIFIERGVLSSADMICCCLNSAIGLGSLKLGATFTIGLISTFILFIIIWFLSFYSLKLLVLSASFYRESTFEEIWKSAFSRSTVFIPGIISILSSLADMTAYIQAIQSSIISICTKIIVFVSDESDEMVMNLEPYKMLFGSAIFILFLLPVCIATSTRTIVILSYISISFIILFTFFVIGAFGFLVKKYGYDPDHSFKFFNPKGNFAKSISTSVFAFTFYPLTYPGIRHVKDSTKYNLTKIFLITMIIIFIYYSIIGTFSYLTFFDKNLNGTVLDYYPENSKTEKIISIFGNIIALIYILFTIPFRLNSCRYIILNAISNNSTFPPDIWAFMGITMAILSLALANFSDKFLNILFIISDVMASFLLFIFTPLYYLRAFGFQDRFNSFISIVLLIAGVLTIIFMIIYDGFY